MSRSWNATFHSQMLVKEELLAKSHSCSDETGMFRAEGNKRDVSDLDIPNYRQRTYPLFGRDDLLLPCHVCAKLTKVGHISSIYVEKSVFAG